MELSGGGAANSPGKGWLLEFDRSTEIGNAVASDSTDEDLAARAAGGDERAFRLLFERHSSRIFGLATRLTSDRELAERVLLEAFADAWNGLSGFRGDSRFGTWLYGIALNRARQAVRSRARRRKRQGALEYESAIAVAPSLQAAIEERIDLERAMAELPERARETLILRHVQGLSCEEVAAVMDVTTGTVKSQTSRACALLREKLSK